MNLLKYYIFLFVTLYVGCSDAGIKSSSVDLSCPYFLSSETKLLGGWITVGHSSEKLQLRVIGIIDPNTSDIKNRLFSEEIIDEWQDFNDRSESIVEYDKDHGASMLKCIYARSESETSDHNTNNMVLLIPLPSAEAVSCLLTRRDTDPTHEISCKVK